jgi:cell division protein ZapA (FtsZ GTPase activity inhibitor)
MSNIYILSNELCDFCNVPHGTRMHIKQIVRKIEDYIVENKLQYPHYSYNAAIYFDDNLKKIFNKIDNDICRINKIINKINEEITFTENKISLRLKENKEKEEDCKLGIQNDLNYIDERLATNPECTTIINTKYLIYAWGTVSCCELFGFTFKDMKYDDFKKDWQDLLINKFKPDTDHTINYNKALIQDYKNSQDELKKYTHNINDIDIYLEMSGHLTAEWKEEFTETINKVSTKLDNIKTIVSFSSEVENDLFGELTEVNKLLRELEDMYNSK